MRTAHALKKVINTKGLVLGVIADVSNIRTFILKKDLKGYDIIKGKVADDRIYDVFSRFLSNSISLECLIECLQMVRLGEQYVLKTDRAYCRAIVTGEKVLFGQELSNVVNIKLSTRKGIKEKVDGIISKYNGTKGTYIDSILKEWS